jgi:hypothetical protein
MAWRLEQKKEDYFGEHVEEIVDICTEASNHYLVPVHTCLARSIIQFLTIKPIMIRNDVCYGRA